MSAGTAELVKPNGTTAIAPATLPKTIRGLLNTEEIKREIARAVPKHVSPDRIIRCALTACTKTPKLLECTQASFMESMLSLSQTGLEPDGKQASLIPYKDKCTLIIGYQGYVKLVYQSGLVQTIHADVVCENDDFEYDRGAVTKHKIDLKRPRGAVYAVYAICRFKDGGETADVMTRDEVESIRKRSRAGNNGPWVTDWNEMAKKTVFRRLSKWLPQSAEMQRATEIDDDSILETTAVVVSEMPKGDTKTDQLTELLASRGEESNEGSSTSGFEPNDESPPFDDSQVPLASTTDDVQFDAYGIATWDELGDPKISKDRNLSLLQEIGAKRNSMDPRQFQMLSERAAANAERMKKK